MERLQKVLARAGVASRRGAEELIAQGRVSVDGQVVSQPGTKADPTRSVITVDGKPLRMPAEHHYVVIHKPVGYITTRRDDFARPTVMDLIPPGLRRLVFPVGRLDAESSGLLLLTDDGELAFRLTHPRFHIPKAYRATVLGRPSSGALAALRRGVELEDGMTGRAEAAIIEAGASQSVLSLTIRQGRKRQVRRMCEAVGHPVLQLARTSMGPLTLGDLPPGKSRPLTTEEVDALKAATSTNR
jgi:23S rRNA pseudouridine2605 synthase